MYDSALNTSVVSLLLKYNISNEALQGKVQKTLSGTILKTSFFEILYKILRKAFFEKIFVGIQAPSMLCQGYKCFLLKFANIFTTAILLKAPEKASKTVRAFKEFFSKMFSKVFLKNFRVARS